MINMICDMCREEAQPGLWDNKIAGNKLWQLCGDCQDELEKFLKKKGGKPCRED